MGTIFGDVIVSLDTSNEFLLFLSPNILICLIAFIFVGDFEVGIFAQNSEWLVNMNDGKNLEFFHVLGVSFIVFVFFSSIIYWRLQKLTTEI